MVSLLFSDRLSVNPGWADEGGAGKVGNAGFAAVYHADEHVDGCLAGDVVVLIHSGPVGATVSPFKLDQADISYSVSDGANWIRNQYNQRLPMLDANILDYYHLREHVIGASYKVFGESTPAALSWRESMMEIILKQGPLAFLDVVGALHRTLRAKVKRTALASLRNYVAKRVTMLEYPTFRSKDYEIGSGPTEAYCKTLTSRLKGPGMRWDRPHAEGLMALAAVRSSGLWQQYWQLQRHAAA